MKTFIGTKLVRAKAMTRAAYNEFRGWTVPPDECGDDEGFIVEDLGGPPNTSAYSGYISWSPAAVFAQTYRPVTGMNFGQALEALKAGKKVCRAGWNGKGMFLFLVPGSKFHVNRKPLLGIYPEGTEIEYHAHIDMKTAQGYVVPWLASQADMLSEDWEVTE